MSGCRLKCPHCGADRNKTTDSSIVDDVAYRRRKCDECGKLFSSVEIVMPDGMRHAYRSTVEVVGRQRKATHAEVVDTLRMLGQPSLAAVPFSPKQRKRFAGKLPGV